MGRRAPLACLPFALFPGMVGGGGVTHDSWGSGHVTRKASADARNFQIFCRGVLAKKALNFQHVILTKSHMY